MASPPFNTSKAPTVSAPLKSRIKRTPVSATSEHLPSRPALPEVTLLPVRQTFNSAHGNPAQQTYPLTTSNAVAIASTSSPSRVDSARGSFEKPSLDTVRPVLGSGAGMNAGSGFGTFRASKECGQEDATDDEGQSALFGRERSADRDRRGERDMGCGMAECRSDPFRYESEEPDSIPQPQQQPSRVYVSNVRTYGGRSASAAGWNGPEGERDRDRDCASHQCDRPGTSSGYYPQSSQFQQAPELRALQNAQHERRTSDTLRPDGKPVPRSPSGSSVPALMRHRRSPTAPSPPTTSNTLARAGEKENRGGVKLAAGQDPCVKERAGAAGVGGSYGPDVGGYGGWAGRRARAGQVAGEVQGGPGRVEKGGERLRSTAFRLSTPSPALFPSSAIPDPNHVIGCSVVCLSLPAPSSEKDGRPKQLLELATPVPPDVVDALKGCLTRDPKGRKTILELLNDPWLRSWRYTATASQALKLKDNEAIMNEAWLTLIMEHASREAMENGAWMMMLCPR